MIPPLPNSTRPSPTHAAGEHAAAVALVLGALGAALALVDSALFDLERYQLPKTLVLHLTAVALLALRWRAPVRRFTTPDLLLLGFVVWSGTSTLLATNRWLAVAAWGITLSGFVVYRASAALRDPTARNLALTGVVGAVVVAALLGVVQAYGLEASWLDGDRAPGGTLGNRNFLAHLSAIATPVLLVFALAPGARARRWASLAGLALVALAIVLTRSRAGWLGAGLALAVTVVALVRVRRARGVPSRQGLGWPAIALALGALAAVALPNALQWTDDSPYIGTLSRLADFREGSGRGRLIQYRNSLELTLEAPLLGVGPGNWFVHYPTVTEPGDPAFGGHLEIPTNPWPSSDWVAFTAERGILGVLILALAGLWLFAQAVRATSSPSPEYAHRAAAAAGVLVATLVTGLFDAVLLLPTPTLVVFALLGLLVGDGGLPDADTPTDSSRHRGARAVVAAVCVLLAAGTAFHTRAVALTTSSTDVAVLERAARLAPWEHRLHLRLAEAGSCPNARRAAALMPFHARPAELVAACGDSPP